jgi:hypothetical protein
MSRAPRASSSVTAPSYARVTGADSLPSTFFIDREGILRARTIGPVFGNLLPDGIAEADRVGEGGS